MRNFGETHQFQGCHWGLGTSKGATRDLQGCRWILCVQLPSACHHGGGRWVPSEAATTKHKQTSTKNVDRRNKESTTKRCFEKTYAVTELTQMTDYSRTALQGCIKIFGSARETRILYRLLFSHSAQKGRIICISQYTHNYK